MYVQWHYRERFMKYHADEYTKSLTFIYDSFITFYNEMRIHEVAIG